MLVSRILSRVSRSAGLRSSLSAAALTARNQALIFSSPYHSFVHDFSHKGQLLAAQVSLDSFSLRRFSFSSSTSPESNEKASNTEASSKTSDEKATAESNESGLDSESTKDSTTDSAKRRRKGAKRAAVSESDSESDDDEELSMDDLMKLVAEKEELLSDKEKEIKQMKDKVLRTYAEMENVMDRTRRDAENTKKYAIQNFAKSLLDVADNLGRASSVVKESFSKLDTSKDSAGAAPLLKTLLEGVEMTEKQLAEVFKKSGMEKYDPINEPFDPNRHNAVFQVPDASKPEGTVAHVLKETSDFTRMAVTEAENPLLGEITCGTLLQKLQEIWDEVGESDEERDKLLLQIEEECLNVYKKKVEQAAKSRAELLQTLSDANIELSNLTTALGDKSYIGIPDKTSGTIKEQLSAIAPALEQLWQQKEERVREFSDVQSQIQKICEEIAGGLNNGPHVVDESDLSLKRFDDYKRKLQELQKEKSDRLRKVLEFVSTVHDLCAVLGLDFLSTVTEVHPSLDEASGVQNKSISNETLSRLAKTVLTLKEDKVQRLKKLQELATQLTDLWNLMDTPDDERQLFDNVTCNISASVHEVTVSGALALDLIEQAEVEVDRLDQLKASRMKEIAFKKQSELEEIYARAHIEIKPEVVRERIMSLIDSGHTEPAELLADMDSQIAKAKEEAFSRKEILDRVEKWMSACEEESWLEDYNRDQNRYSASRGAHLNLKRAEKARILVSKITAMVDTLVAKTRAWEEDNSISFEYDGVPLLAMLDEYTMLRQEREEEKRRLKEQKKQQEQPHADQDFAFGSKPSPARPVSAKKPVGTRANGGGLSETPIRRLSMNSSQNGSKSKRDSLNKLASPSNLVAISKEDAASPVPCADPVLASP